MKRLRATFLLVIMALLLTMLALPITGQPIAAQTESSNALNVSNLRVVNGLVGLGAVDIFLDGERIAYNLQPEQASSYLFLAAGEHTLTVRRVGDDPLAVPISDTLLDLPPNNSQTAIIYQKIFAPGPNQQVQGQPAQPAPTYEQVASVYIMTDDRSPIPLGKTRLTAVHLAAGTPGNLSIGYPTRASLLHQLGLEKPYGTIDVESGAYSLAVIDADSPELTILNRPGEINFFSSTLYTLILVPNMTPTGSYTVAPAAPEPRLFIISAPVNPPRSGIRLRIIHAAHSSAVLDVYIDERLVASRVNFGQATEYLGIENYGHTITLRRFADPPSAPPIGRSLFTITPENQTQKTWTLLLVNSNPQNTAALEENTLLAGSNAPQVFNTPGGEVMSTILPDNVSETQRNFARVRIINAADGVPPLRLLTQEFPPPPPPPGVTPTPPPVPTLGPTPPPIEVTQGVVFGTEANEREIPAGFYGSLDFAPVGSLNSIEQLDSQQLVSGVVYTYILMGSPTGNPPLRVVALADYGEGLSVERLYLGVIIASSANVRNAPSANSARLLSLPNDYEVDVLGRNTTSEWIRIRFRHPTTGLISEGWMSGTSGLLQITRLGAPVQVGALPLYQG